MKENIAKSIYSDAGKWADKLVRLGRITAEERPEVFANYVLQRWPHDWAVPKTIQAAAAKSVTPAATPVAQVAAKSAATKPVAQAVAKSAATNVAKVGAGQAAKSAFRSSAPIAAVTFAAEAGYIFYKYKTGDIDKVEAQRLTMVSGASNGGGIAGAMAGAAIGSVVPVIGTTIGAIVGGLVGGVGAAYTVNRVTETKPKALPK